MQLNDVSVFVLVIEIETQFSFELFTEITPARTIKELSPLSSPLDLVVTVINVSIILPSPDYYQLSRIASDI